MVEGVLISPMRLYKKPYKPAYMTPLSRQFRKVPTPAEIQLWEELRKKDFFGHHLRRQAPFGRYVFDFYCAKGKIAIELDGDSHTGNEIKDILRDRFLSGCSVRVLRFRNEEIFQNIEAVLAKIRDELS